jgi:hypothetical protein
MLQMQQWILPPRMLQHCDIHSSPCFQSCSICCKS